MIKELVIHTDGACRGNPGPSGAGIVIHDTEGFPIYEGYQFLGHATNNDAEYIAAILGVQQAKKLGATRIHLKCDSSIVIYQTQGIYAVKSDRMAYYVKVLQDELGQFEDGYTLEAIPRMYNTLADKEANKAIDWAYKHGYRRDHEWI